MADTSESFETLRRLKAMAPYFAFLFGITILLFVVFNNKNQDASEKSQNVRNTKQTFETTGPQVPAASQAPNAVTTNGSPTSVSTQPDPFKAFLEAHKIQPPPANIQLAPMTPQEIRDVFKAAVEKDISSAYPFASAQNQKNADRDK